MQPKKVSATRAKSTIYTEKENQNNISIGMGHPYEYK